MKSHRAKALVVPTHLTSTTLISYGLLLKLVPTLIDMIFTLTGHTTEPTPLTNLLTAIFPCADHTD
jgi:hypothetical protein